MARFIYDVDKTTRYIDIHKQFQGGLKTVDTDDSIKDIYLREAENVSLSEFNFLEKRYGLHNLTPEGLAPWVSLSSTSSIVQGYFEYYVDANTVHKIIVIEGKIYVNSGSGFNLIQSFFHKNQTQINTDIFPTTNLAFAETPEALGVGNFNSQVKYVFSNDSYYAYVVATLSWVFIGTSATDSYPVDGFVRNQYYYDTRNQAYYIWTSVSGKTGFMTTLSEELSATVQSTRPVEAVRLDDKLYIATGTRPIYYKGDGKLYVFEKYEISDLDVQKRGYNLNSFDIENEIYGQKYLSQTTSVGPIYELNDVLVRNAIFKEAVKYPLIPYKFGAGTLTFNLAYHLYQNSTNNYWNSGVNQFDSETLPETSPGSGVFWNTPWAWWTLSSGVYTIQAKKFELALNARVFRKPAGTLGSTFYESVGANSIQFKLKRNGTSEIASSLTNDLAYPFTFPSTLLGVVLEDLVITLIDLEVGYFDYKIEFNLSESSYRYQKDANGNDDRTKIPVFYTDNFVLGSTEFNNIWTTPEKLEDYNEAPLNTLRVHSCNRVTEHNGRLCFFGNPQHPDYLFFSDIASKEYIPYFYTLQFTNDLQEPVNAITKFMNILVVQSPSYTWGIKGDSPLPLSELEGQIYQKITINPTIGCIAPHSVKNVRNQLYFLSKEGIFTLRSLFAEDNRYNVDPVDRNIYNIVPRDTNAIATYFDDQYWLHFPTTGETLRYYVDKKAWVKDTYAAWNKFGGVHKYINDSGKLRFITELSQLETGNPVKIFDIELDYSLPTDLTKNITSKFTTSFLNQNQPFHPKNYKEAKFDFAIQNEYNTSLEDIPTSDYAETVNYVQFKANLTDRHFYSITFEPNEIGARPAAYTIEIDNVQVASGNITETNGNLSTIRFMSNKTGNVLVKITSTGKIVIANMSADSIKLYDSTYDHTVTFNTLVLSEEGALNIDPIDSYTTAEVAIPIDLGTRTGNWMFGTSNFGNVILAIKTVKLSGKGYNSKVSVIEDSKSKWTFESLGITYKMKKARSR
jgi:hypothetical protein